MENQSKDMSIGQGLAGKYVALKNWEELTSDEKIERMREIIKQQSNTIGQLQVSLHNARKNLKQHAHINNKVMIVKEAQEHDDPNTNFGLLGTTTLSNANYF